MALALILAVPSVHAANVQAAPGTFENGLTGWRVIVSDGTDITTYGGCYTLVSDSHTGSKALRITSAGTSFQFHLVSSDAIYMDSAKAKNISAWSKSGGGYTGLSISLRTTANPSGSSEQGTTSNQFYPVGTTSYTLNSATFSGITTGYYYIDMYPGPGANSWYQIDDILINGINSETTFPVATMTASPASGTAYAPINVTFQGSGTNSPTSYLWDFGNGLISTRQNTSMVFTQAGTYPITFTATNSYGSSTITQNYQVLVNSTPVNGTVIGTSTNSTYGLKLSPWAYGYTGTPYTSIELTCTDPDRPFDRIVYMADGQRSQTTAGGGTGGLLDYTEFKKTAGVWSYITDATATWTQLTGQQSGAYMYDTAYFKTPGQHSVTAHVYSQGIEIATVTAPITLFDNSQYAGWSFNIYEQVYQTQVDNANVTATDTYTGMTQSQIMTAGTGTMTGVKGDRYNIVITATGYQTLDTYINWPTTPGTSKDWPMTSTTITPPDTGKTYLSIYVNGPDGNKADRINVDLNTAAPGQPAAWQTVNTGSQGYARFTVNKNQSYQYIIQSQSNYIGKTGTITVYDTPLNIGVTLQLRAGAATATPYSYTTPTPQGYTPTPTATAAPGTGTGGEIGGGQQYHSDGPAQSATMVNDSLPGLVGLLIVAFVVCILAIIQKASGGKK